MKIRFLAELCNANVLLPVTVVQLLEDLLEVAKETQVVRVCAIRRFVCGTAN